MYQAVEAVTPAAGSGGSEPDPECKDRADPVTWRTGIHGSQSYLAESGIKQLTMDRRPWTMYGLSSIGPSSSYTGKELSSRPARLPFQTTWPGPASVHSPGNPDRAKFPECGALRPGWGGDLHRVNHSATIQEIITRLKAKSLQVRREDVLHPCFGCGHHICSDTARHRREGLGFQGVFDQGVLFQASIHVSSRWASDLRSCSLARKMPVLTVPSGRLRVDAISS